MSQRDWVFVLVIVLSLSVFGLTAYGFWRGRNAAAPDRDGDALWSLLMRAEAVGLSIFVVTWVVVFVLLPLAAWTVLLGTPIALVAVAVVVRRWSRRRVPPRA